MFFSKVISLSGSFWWPNKALMLDAAAVPFNPVPANSITEQILQDKVDVSHLKIYQNVGSGERGMCHLNNATYQAIHQKGGNVKFELVHGGHDWLSWRSGLIKGLLFLMPAPLQH
ncbi:alpha/beta hydrolase-fold protein [Marinomonas sp. RS-M-Aa-14]